MARGVLTLLGELLRGLRSRPVTIEYGVETGPTPSSEYRGLHRVDPGRCIGCSLCSIECPTGAITMVPLPGQQEQGKKEAPGGRGSGAKRRPKRIPRIDYGLCIFCYHCVQICPVHAYITTNNAPPCVEDRADLVGDRAWERLRERGEGGAAAGSS